ncbi:MAG: hypothetical protein AABX50_01245 [Nanoarchaeota archaeon]
MNKKGFLLAEETLKIIIAVIAIGFLAYFLVSLYFSAKNSQKLEQAKETLPFLISEINAGKTSVDIYNPGGWWLISWPYGGIMPNSCSNLGWSNCICIIPKGVLTNTPAEYSEDSDDGFCMEISKRTIVTSIANEQSPIKIENPPLKLNINNGNEILITKA